MKYFDFLLKFTALILIIEIGWLIFSSILTLIASGIYKISKSINIMVYTLVINNIIYCFLLLSTIILLINNQRAQNDSSFFLFFILTTSFICLWAFFADKQQKRIKIIESSRDFSISKMSYWKLLIVEGITILSFIPLSFFPDFFNNKISILLFDSIVMILELKYFGILIGIVGLLVFGKYIFGFVMGLPALFLNKSRNDSQIAN